MPSPIHGRPLIEYPCEWEYRVIGTDPVVIRSAVTAVVADLEHSLRDGNRKGKYLSMRLVLNVEDEAQRDRIYVGLTEQTGIRMVM